MRISRSCKPKDLNWATLPELPEKLKREGFETVSVDVTLRRTPDNVDYASLEEAAEDVRREGTPAGFSIEVSGGFIIEKGVGREVFRLTITRYRGGGPMDLVLSGLRDKSQLDHVMEFLGLEPSEPQEEATQEPSRPRTAFVAHRFDEAGDDAANKLMRFLKLLDFHVVTGSTYSPRPVSGKVLSRIQGQELCFVVLTVGGDDETGLTQESAIAKLKDKDLFLIKDQNAKFKSGILADVEYIEFVTPNIEDAFIRVMEGLDDLGYLAFR